MSAERLREMVSEATPGPWAVGRASIDAGGDWFPIITPRYGAPICALNRGHDRPGITEKRNAADARLIALAPDAIALLADFADAASSPWTDSARVRMDELRSRLDALCGDER